MEKTKIMKWSWKWSVCWCAPLHIRTWSDLSSKQIRIRTRSLHHDIMNQLKSIYSGPFEDSHSHPIHTYFPIISSNVCNIIFVSNVLVIWVCFKTYFLIDHRCTGRTPWKRYNLLNFLQGALAVNFLLNLFCSSLLSNTKMPAFPTLWYYERRHY